VEGWCRDGLAEADAFEQARALLCNLGFYAFPERFAKPSLRQEGGHWCATILFSASISSVPSLFLRPKEDVLAHMTF
jgi:hypothetical protein